jgi:hypothetical protein
MELLLTRPVVVALAVIGALLATGASYLQLRGYVSIRTGRLLNYAGYGFMGASILLFVLAGLLGHS